jgi:hypothetical protein
VATGPVSSFQEYNAVEEVSENDQHPTNDPSRHQSQNLESRHLSQTLESHALESSQDHTGAGNSEVVPDAICSILDRIGDMEKRISCGWHEEQALRAHEEASLEDISIGNKWVVSEHSGTAVPQSPQQLSAWSAVLSQKTSPSHADLGLRLEDSDIAMASSSQATMPPLSARAAYSHAQEPCSPSIAASETPRNWEEQALELQAQLAAAQLQAQLDREGLEAKVQELQARLQHESLLRGRESSAVRAATHASTVIQAAGLRNECVLFFTLP